jgi:hypothetical protein
LVGVAFLDVPTALRLAGLLYLLVPVTVYLVLRRSHDCRSLMAWCGGASLYGLGYLLIGLRTVHSRLGVDPRGQSHGDCQLCAAHLVAAQ